MVIDEVRVSAVVLLAWLHACKYNHSCRVGTLSRRVTGWRRVESAPSAPQLDASDVDRIKATAPARNCRVA
jgi:hypothetical protein